MSNKRPVVMLRKGASCEQGSQASTPAQRLQWLAELTVHSCKLAGIDPDPQIPRSKLPGRLIKRPPRD